MARVTAERMGPAGQRAEHKEYPHSRPVSRQDSRMAHYVHLIPGYGIADPAAIRACAEQRAQE